jgi:hypothetical protein
MGDPFGMEVGESTKDAPNNKPERLVVLDEKCGVFAYKIAKVHAFNVVHDDVEMLIIFSITMDFANKRRIQNHAKFDLVKSLGVCMRISLFDDFDSIMLAANPMLHQIHDSKCTTSKEFHKNVKFHELFNGDFSVLRTRRFGLPITFTSFWTGTGTGSGTSF